MKDKKKLLFMGRKQVAADCLEWLVKLDESMDSPMFEIAGVLTDDHLPVSPTKDVAIRNNIKIYNFDSAMSAMKEGALDYDIGVSMLYWRKLKDLFLSVPKLGNINFHPAPLPDYKGTAGYNIAILEGLKQWAATAHYVDENIDTGEIVEVSKFDFNPDKDTAQTLEKATQPILFNLFRDVLCAALTQDTKLKTIKNQGGRYISRKEMESMKEIKEGDDISRKIRAFWFPPYDGAYIKINNKKYTLIDDFILKELAAPSQKYTIF
tara:strand:+ start:302 stop:1096 length:795 start_codon:yes stop_codon:yes gene_type:complete